MIIKLKIKNKNTELTFKEEEDLYDQLDQVFGNKSNPFPFIPYYDPQPVDTTPKYPNPYIWWGATDGDGSFSISDNTSNLV